jgi:ribosomal protein S18 acetylase RimI-like enzyme
MTDVRLEPMTEHQYKPWRAEAQAHYAQSLAASGQPAQDAVLNAADTYAQLLPDEFATPDHHFWYAYDGARRVGCLWVKVTHDAAFVYNVAVEPDVRRRGYGRAIMLAAERWCHDNALRSIGLHVFAHNTGARALYERLGFAETGRTMAKDLTTVDTTALLAAYDAQMRMPTGAVPSGVHYEHDGPLLRIVGGHVGRVRAPRDVGVTGAELDRLIVRQRDYFRARGQGVEWKLRAHDLPAELPERLVAAGFVPERSSAVLLGFAEEVAAEPVLPEGVVLRRISAAEDLRRFADQQTEVSGSDCSWVAADLSARLSADPTQITVLVAEADGRFACTAFAVYSPGTDFVALLGGATLPAWRGRGLYRAMVAARAREAVTRGFRLLHVDASPASASILRRCGFHEITTSTHHHWTPPR